MDLRRLDILALMSDLHRCGKVVEECLVSASLNDCIEISVVVWIFPSSSAIAVPHLLAIRIYVWIRFANFELQSTFQFFESCHLSIQSFTTMQSWSGWDCAKSKRLSQRTSNDLYVYAHRYPQIGVSFHRQKTSLNHVPALCALNAVPLNF